jgi:hypothetical protein
MMNFILLGLAWFLVAIFSIYFINKPAKSSEGLMRIGLGLMVFSFLAGLSILFAAIIFK